MPDVSLTQDGYLYTFDTGLGRGVWREPGAALSDPAFGTPPVTVKLTASAGTAVTALRSDAQLALDQGIAPTWSAQHTFTLAPVVSSLTPSRVVVSDGSKALASSSVTTTELGYLSGAGSNIQTQLNGKEQMVAAGLTTQYYRGNKTWATLDTAAVPENGNLYFTNTRADARITAQKALPNGLATLDSAGKIPTSQLPALAITDTFVVGTQSAMLALTAETGDVCVRSDLNKSYILAGTNPATLSHWQELLTPTDAVLSVNGQTGAVVLTTTHINEGTNLYYTNARARAALSSASANQISYNPSTGVFGTPQDIHTGASPQFVGLTLTGNLSAAGVASHLIPSATDTYDLGTSTKLWRKGWFSELDAVLFAQNTVSLVGGWLMATKNEGTIPAGQDVSAGATSIDFGQAMTANDFVLFRAAGAVEYVQVGSLVSGTRYNVTRNLDGSGANAWPAGSVYAVLGNTGNGRIEINANATPRISLIRQGATYNAQTELTRLGDLNGWGAYVAETYGLAAGQYGVAGQAWFSVETTNGYRIGNNTTTLYQVDAAGNATFGNTGQANMRYDSAAQELQFRVGSTVHAAIDGLGKFSFGGSTGTLGSSGLWMKSYLTEVNTSNITFTRNADGGVRGDIIMQENLTGSGTLNPRLDLSSYAKSTETNSVTEINLYASNDLNHACRFGIFSSGSAVSSGTADRQWAAIGSSGTFAGLTVGIYPAYPSHMLDVAGTGYFSGALTVNDRVGIGTTSAADALHVAVSNSNTTFPNTLAGVVIQNTNATDNNYSAIFFNNSAGASDVCFGAIHIAASATGASRRGAFAVGTAGTVAGGIVERFRINDSGNVRFNSYGAGTLTTDASGNVTASSDEDLKEIAPGRFKLGLDVLRLIEPITYRWKKETGFDTRNDYHGFGARNVKKAFEAHGGRGAWGYNADGTMTLQERALTAVVVNSVKELDSRVTQLEQENEALRKELRELKGN